MRKFSAFMVSLFVASCSIPDGDDMAELERRIAALPAQGLSDIRRWTARLLVLDLFKSKSPNEKVGDIACQIVDSVTGKVITKWAVESEVRVDDVLKCLLDIKNVEIGYLGCAMQLADQVRSSVMNSGNWKQLFDGVNADLECEPFFVPNYEPDRVAAEARDADRAEEGDMQRLGELLTYRQIAEALMKSVNPPPIPGLVLGGSLGSLLPVLCALGTDWGCPQKPDGDYP